MPEDRYFLRLDRPSQGADTILLSDDFVEKWAVYDSGARGLALAPLSDFVIYKGPDGSLEDRWFPTAEGLETVQGLLNRYRRPIEPGTSSASRFREYYIPPLERFESLLLGAAATGAKFFIAHRDHGC